MATITEAAAIVDSISIVPNPPTDPNRPGNRLILAAHTVSAAGETLRTFTADVTGSLTATEQSRIDAIVTRAQAWADNRMATG